MNTQLSDLIESTVTIGTIPRTLAEIQKVVADPKGSTSQIVEIIEKDPAVASKVLRFANSSFYAVRNPITSIHNACVILGSNVITSMVIQSTVLGRYSTGPETEGFDPSCLWDHSFKSALAARLMCKISPDACGLDPDDAYTCGLLHDVGKILLLQNEPFKFADALRLSKRENLPLAKAETEVFGFSDLDACSHLARRWKLGRDIEVSVMRFTEHDNVAEDSARKAQLVHCASTIAHQVANSSNGWIGDLASSTETMSLNIPEERLEEVRNEVRNTSVLS